MSGFAGASSRIVQVCAGPVFGHRGIVIAVIAALRDVIRGCPKTST